MTRGPDLQAASAVVPFVSSQRLVLARELKAWTQQEVVRQMSRSFSAAALSQLEHGHSQPAPSTLIGLSEVYGCPLEFFVDRPGDRQPEGFFRSLRSSSARDRKQYIARARILRDFVHVIEDHIRLPDLDVPRIPVSAGRPDEVEAAAERVREAWNLGEGPIGNVVRTIERHGVVVVRVAGFTNEVDAFSVCFPDRPIVVIGSDKGVTARSRFDAAHELAHLVLHSDVDAGTKEAESQAHAFAAAFLMPASMIRDQLPDRMDLRTLTRLKVEWRVSINALLMRAKTLGVMEPARYTSCMKMMSAKGWRTREPGDDLLGALETPRLLPAAIDRLRELGLSIEDICREGALPVAEVQRILERTRDARPQLEL